MPSSILNSDDGVISGTSGLKNSGGDDAVLLIQTNGTTAQTVDSGQRTKFPTTIGVGDATPSASGSGITFPATQSASSDANTLDDYEEGTWTPSLGGDATYSGTPLGFYVKVGSLVLVRGGFAVATIGTGSTTVISGLPFTTTNENANRVSGSVSYYDSLNVNVIALYVYAQPNNTQVSFASSNASGVTFTNDPAAIFKNAANVQFTMTYRAA
jgi:hypothetical protein